MGSPIVFHTAPPQPASKARMTWYAVFAGGPDAIQNGFGLRMPAQSVVRSAMASTPRVAQVRVDRAGRGLAVRDRVHDLLAAVHAVTARVELRHARPAARVDVHLAAVQVDAGERGFQPARVPLLTDRRDGHVARDVELGAGDGLELPASALDHR